MLCAVLPDAALNRYDQRPFLGRRAVGQLVAVLNDVVEIFFLTQFALKNR